MSDAAPPGGEPDGDDAVPPPDAPRPGEFAGVFRVEEIRREDETVVYLGEPQVGPEALEQEVWPLFRAADYEVRLDTVEETDPLTGVALGSHRYALLAEPRSVGLDGVPWTNVAMLVATVATTLYAGTIWYHEPVGGPLDLVTGDSWKFAAALLFVLGVHELGHYVMSRYHEVAASLPYFIPIPSFIGTLGAVIRMKGRIPDREALFDIGVAGPLAGLAATLAVTVVGLYMDPVVIPDRVLNSDSAVEIVFGYPLLIQWLADLTGQPFPGPHGAPMPEGTSLNPVVYAGWVGMFVTFLNLIPAGQLDGGHITRAIAGDRHETVSALVPGALFALAAYLYLFVDTAGRAPFLWSFWGLLTLGVTYMGAATPVYDDALDRGRVALGIATFVLGLLCFTPVPFRIVA